MHGAAQGRGEAVQCSAGMGGAVQGQAVQGWCSVVHAWGGAMQCRDGVVQCMCGAVQCRHG